MSIPDTSIPLGMTLGFRIKPGQVVVGNTKEGEKTIIFDAATSTDGAYRFYNCSGLTSWNVELPNLTTGTNMFSGCTALTSWNVELPKLTDGTNMFFNCNLSAEGVNLILNSIPDRASAGLSVGKLSIGRRINFKTDPDVKELLGETGAEITAKTYRFKGWDVAVQN